MIDLTPSVRCGSRTDAVYDHGVVSPMRRGGGIPFTILGSVFVKRVRQAIQVFHVFIIFTTCTSKLGILANGTGNMWITGAHDKIGPFGHRAVTSNNKELVPKFGHNGSIQCA